VGVNLLGEGRAVLLRGNLRYEALWRRYGPDQLMQLYYQDGTVLPFKPGTIWYNVTDTGKYMGRAAYWPTP
jgi:hypothetical protein